MPSNHLILYSPFLLLPSIFPSIRVFSNESALHIRWPKYWSFSFSKSPCNEYSGLFSFRIDWFDLLAVQGTLKSFLQHHSLKALIKKVLSLFYCPPLTSTHDYWKNHSFDSMDLCKQLLVIGEIQVKISMRYSTYPQWLHHFISSYKLLKKI